MLSNPDIQKALRIKRAVNEYFEKSSERMVQAKELMPLFIDKGIFTSNAQDGLPIREFLRHLDDNNQLGLIPQVFYMPKEKNKNWFFLNPAKRDGI